MDNSYPSALKKLNQRKKKNLTTFFQSNSRDSTNLNSQESKIQNLKNFDASRDSFGQRLTQDVTQNALLLDNESEESLPCLSKTNTSVLGHFKSSSAQKPYERMLKNMSKQRKMNPYEFGQLREKSQMVKHLRSNTEQNLLDVDITNYYKNDLEADLLNLRNEHKSFQQKLPNFSKYKNKKIIDKTFMKRNIETTTSVDNIHIRLDKKADNRRVKNREKISQSCLKELPKSIQKSHKSTISYGDKVRILKDPKVSKNRNLVQTQKKFLESRKVQNKSVLNITSRKSYSPLKDLPSSEDSRLKFRKKSQRNVDAQEMTYKPYTLRDYKLNYLKSKEKDSQMGGLGPNKDTNFLKASEAALKVRYFSNIVRDTNRDDPQTSFYRVLKPKNGKEKSKRVKGIEFANRVQGKFRKTKQFLAMLNQSKPAQGVEERLPMYQKDMKFEAEAIKMFYG